MHPPGDGDVSQPHTSVISDSSHSAFFNHLINAPAPIISTTIIPSSADAPTPEVSDGPMSTSEVSPKEKATNAPSAPGSIGPLHAGLLSLPTLQEQQQHQRLVPPLPGPPLSSFPLSLHLPLPVAPAVTGSSSGAGAGAVAGIDRFLSPSVAQPALPPPLDVALAVSVATAPVTSSSQANSSSALVGSGASIGVDGAHLPYHIYFGPSPVGSGPEDTIPNASATSATAGSAIGGGGSGLGTGLGAGSALPSIASTVAAAAVLSSADHFRLVHAETTAAAPSAEFGETLETSVPTPAAMDMVSSSSSFCRLGGHQQEQHRQQQRQQQRQPEQEDPGVERPETPPPVSEVEMKGNAPWTAEEDERLRQAARRHSLKHWKKIARFVGGEEERQWTGREGGV